MIDAGKINEMLAARAEEVCRLLLPNGRVERNEWVIGNIEGKAGNSLKVCLGGPKLGVWADFKESQHRGRHLLSLWTAVRGGDFKKAIEEAKDFLGIDEPRWRDEREMRPPRGMDVQPAQEAHTPKLEEEFVPLVDGGAVYRYLTEERKLTAESLELYRIGESKDGEYVVFPSYDPSGEKLLRLKFVSLARNEKEKPERTFVLPKGAPACLFGMHVIDDVQMELVIVEGEIDAMSMRQALEAGVSVPFGAKWAGADGKDPNSEWVDHDYDWLQRFVEIMVATDCDEPGDRAAGSIALRLGLHRVRRLIYPKDCKDANECLCEGVTPEEMIEAWEHARNYDPAELRRPTDFRKETWRVFYPEDEHEIGDEPPWSIPFRFRPGEMTVWQSYTSHGKSVCLGQNMLYVGLQHQRRSCIASLEIKPEQTIAILERQLLGKQKPESEVEHDAALGVLDDMIWIYDYVGTAKIDDVLEVFEYAAKRYSVSHFVLDSLMRLDLREDDHEAQKDMMNTLLAFAAKYNVHVHLVAHSKKPDSKHPENTHWPTKYQVRGTAHIVDLAHNVICVFRFKKKEEELAKAELPNQSEEKREELLAKWSGHYDALFIVQKQRLGGQEPIKQLWFDQLKSQQFSDDPDNLGESWLPEKVYNELEGTEGDGEIE